MPSKGMVMARRKAPAITPEERERNRRDALDRQRARCAEIAKAKTIEARAWLVAAGALVPGEGVRERLIRLDQYRHSLVQASAQTPAYRPTARQLQAKPCEGVEVEIEF